MITPVVNGCYLCRHPVVTDARGHLLPIESGADVPFAIERVYLLYGAAPGVERGFHAHRALHQRTFCVSGSCTFVLDNGHQRRHVRLDSADIGLHMGPMIWREMRDFSPDCVLMTLASAPYNEDDYIRDYGEFLADIRDRRSS
jgi:dTDP-4-dehydrorhamnose 3,5-epimerase-like enzyme